MNAGMVIIGAGESGARAAEELRRRGWEGTVTLIGREEGVPYERPPLSKELLTAETLPSPAAILTKEKLMELDIRFVANIEATRIDRSRHSIMLASNEVIPYEKLLLATGASPRKLSIEGSDLSGILYLRTFADAAVIRRRLQAGQHIVVIGGGFIGLEVAASARKNGCQVTLLEVGPRILTRGVPEQIAIEAEKLHLNEGVAFKLGIGISRIERMQGTYRITLADESSITCDTVIAGIGAVPSTALAEACGLETANGICVDETLQTSDPAIYAAGDCCSFAHRLYGGKRMRLESWRNAQDQGIHAAVNMLGGTEPYEAVPWFWSDQYDQMLQVAGLPEYGVTTVKRGGDKPNSFFFHLDESSRLVAASAIGSGIAKDIRLCEMLIEYKAILQPELLAKADLKLKDLLADSRSGIPI